MSSGTEIYIHVGLHKTGTTFLQQQLFKRIEEIQYIHRTTYDIDCPIKKNKKNLISAERLSGSPSAIHTEKNDHKRMYTIADNLKAMYPDAKIIVGLREKEAWVKSVYKQFVKQHPQSITLQQFKKRLDPGFLDFDAYVAYLQDTFDQVYVYQYEDLRRNHQEFCNAICDFIGVKHYEVDNIVYNKSLSDGQERLIKAAYRCAMKAYLLFRYLLELSNRRNV